ncbi:flavin monoamine oxidase family protein [Paenibacillus sambharensis]|uniref:flavin monoamine oxidase family protein n=1 Tax=Paenibacillus sambharensis TaxID=1803190 RepID=UPI0015E89699|nr:flavin monoamine oxidase family protein [Paenibacillus sambharensis]
MSDHQMGAQLSRRQFLIQVAKAGGAVAMYSAMGSLGLLGSPAGAAAVLPPPAELEMTKRGGRKIVILGAGIAGMTAAYEMAKIGYDCVILEARSRPGGRNWTIRRGDTVTEVGGAKQTARFDEGEYFNPGPARIPQHHITMDYCKELGVALEVFGNVNEAAYYYSENAGPLSGRKIPKRAAKADMRGFTSELLAKAINKNALDLPLSQNDKEKLLIYLQREGDLNADLFYKGSGRRGYKVLPGGGETPGEQEDPYNISAIIQSGFGNSFSSEYSLDQQMMMFQPVGGMDQIGRALAKKVGSVIRYQAVVQQIKQNGSGVTVSYKDAAGAVQEVEGEYCICTIPLSVLKDIPADFSKEMAAAIAKVHYAETGKIGFQFRRRFWEEDENIFSGMTTTNMDINQIWYPSSGYLGRKGIVVGYYNFGEQAVKLGDMTLAGREEYALKQGAKIHHQFYKEFETSFSIAWHKTPYNLGGWASYSSEDRKTIYPTLNKPDGRIYLAGEHMSYLTGWMAGAFESARLVVNHIHERVMTQ